MKFVIDLIEDLRYAIGNGDDFIVGVLAVQKEPDAEGNALLAWGKGISRAEVDAAGNRLNFYVGEGKPMRSGEVVALLDEMANNQMMYEVFISRKEQPERADAPLIGFAEDGGKKQYMLLIEEAA